MSKENHNRSRGSESRREPIFRLFYELSLLGYGVIQLPRLAWSARRDKESSLRLQQRLGCRLPDLQPQEGRRLWVHAVSVGEVRAVAPLVARLCKEESNAQVVVSCGTSTGLAEARRSIPQAAAHLILPFDLSWVIRPLVRRFCPHAVWVTETDYWFNFLHEARRCGARVISVNAKISERSAQRYERLPRFLRKPLEQVDLFCLQDKEYFERMRQIGIEEQRLCITGNIKLDQKLSVMRPEEVDAWRCRLKLPEGVPVVAIGSTHAPEEQELLWALEPLWDRYPGLRILLIPRHPERFEEVASLLQRMGLSYGRLSQSEQLTGEERILLIDGMGVLCACYQLAQVALVAGSWGSRVGGHNILEPLHFGTALLFGPHMEAQPTLTRFVLEGKAGHQVEVEQVGGLVERLLEDVAMRAQLCEYGKRVLLETGGATEATWKAIQKKAP